MAVITVGRTDTAQDGLQAFDGRRHLRQVAELIGTVFANELDANGRSALQEWQTVARLNPILGNLMSTAFLSDVVSGFVWVDKGRVIGNVTMQRSGAGGSRWRISNVAVAEEYRRHGIARTLMLAALREIAQRGGNWALLEVRANNPPARRLYEQLGFKHVCQEGVWRLDALPQTLPSPNPAIPLTPLRSGDWQARLELAYSSRSPLAQWAEPIDLANYEPGIRQAIKLVLGNLTGLQRSRRWGIWEKEILLGEVEAVASATASAHRLCFTVRPEAHGQVETTLVAHGLQVLAEASPRPIVSQHNGDHVEGVAALETVGFQAQQVLVTMRRPILLNDVDLPVPEPVFRS